MKVTEAQIRQCEREKKKRNRELQSGREADLVSSMQSDVSTGRKFESQDERRRQRRMAQVGKLEFSPTSEARHSIARRQSLRS